MIRKTPESIDIMKFKYFTVYENTSDEFDQSLGRPMTLNFFPFTIVQYDLVLPRKINFTVDVQGTAKKNHDK